MKIYKLTEYSHGSGCGCKLAPQKLEQILKGNNLGDKYPDLLVGNEHKDDAAVLSIDENFAIISTTDFFMPIVDDPYDFGRIAATNAISDIYAMGGKPLMAISIFGWPIDKLPEEIGREVISGGRQVCAEANIPLAGGHSIDSPEPIFGLAVTGIIKKDRLKTNAGAQPGDMLFLTKPLGIGILTTAEKKGLLRNEDKGKAVEVMLKTNSIGASLSEIAGVHALTDVTGFGLLGHLIEMCEASNVSASINYARIPVLQGLEYYIEKGSNPGGTFKNFKSYGHKVAPLSNEQKLILCDPQTSGGLLVSVSPRALDEFKMICEDFEIESEPVGQITSNQQPLIVID